MVASVEYGHTRTSREGPRDAAAVEGRLAARAAEQNLLLTKTQVRELLRELALQGIVQSEVPAARQLGANGLLHFGRPVAEEMHAEAHQHVDVAVAVGIVEIGSLATLEVEIGGRVDRLDQLESKMPPAAALVLPPERGPCGNG